MKQAHVSIGQVKRDISQLVNRVAYGSESIVLTSRGKPKAVLVSLADYERLLSWREDRSLSKWTADKKLANSSGESWVRTIG